LEPSPETMYDVSEAAKRMGISPHTVRKLIRLGELEHYRIRRAIRISEAQIQAYLKQNKA
jgi:excisionase family DNA binding protein